MKDFFSATVSGFFFGVMLGVILFTTLMEHVDIPAQKIDQATKACLNANSTLVSVDHYLATCANLAEIPYNRQGSK